MEEWLESGKTQLTERNRRLLLKERRANIVREFRDSIGVGKLPASYIIMDLFNEDYLDTDEEEFVEEVERINDLLGCAGITRSYVERL